MLPTELPRMDMRNHPPARAAQHAREMRGEQVAVNTRAHAQHAYMSPAIYALVRNSRNWIHDSVWNADHVQPDGILPAAASFGGAFHIKNVGASDTVECIIRLVFSISRDLALLLNRRAA